MYVLNNTASKYVREKLMEMPGEIDESNLTVGDFNVPASEMDRSNRQKINKDRVELSGFISQLDVTDIYIVLHKTTQNTDSSQAHTDHAPKQTISWSVKHPLPQRTDIIQHIHSDHNGITLESNTIKTAGKFPNILTSHIF